MDTRIHVRGGLYEVDINNGVVHPVYWKGRNLAPEYFSPEFSLVIDYTIYDTFNPSPLMMYLIACEHCYYCP